MSSAMSSDAGKSEAPKSQRLFVKVENFDIPATGFHYAEGHVLTNPTQKVRVRLTTAKEREADFPKIDPAKIKSQYTGENCRDSLKQKADNKISLITFDDARLLSTDANGVQEFRAHWPTTISTTPEVELLNGYGHIRLVDKGHEQGSQAFINMVESHAFLEPETGMDFLKQAMLDIDSNGNARDPFVVIRAFYNGEVKATAQIFPAHREEKIFDQNLGEEKIIYKTATPKESLDALWQNKPNEKSVTTYNKDVARALIVASTNKIPPPHRVTKDGLYDLFASDDPQRLQDLRNLFIGVRQGELQVECVSCVKIDFGADSRKSYLAASRQPQYSGYMVSRGKGTPEQPAPLTAGYTLTMVACLRHPDGEPYAVYASPLGMFPNAKPLNRIILDSGMEVGAEKQAQAPAPLEPIPDKHLEDSVKAVAPEPEDDSPSPGM